MEYSQLLPFKIMFDKKSDRLLLGCVEFPIEEIERIELSRISKNAIDFHLPLLKKELELMDIDPNHSDLKYKAVKPNTGGPSLYQSLNTENKIKVINQILDTLNLIST